MRPDETTVRRRRRVIRSEESAPAMPAQPISKTILATGVDPMIARKLQQLRDYVRTKNYENLGLLSTIQIIREDGRQTIDFRSDRMTIARAYDKPDLLLLVTPWQGIPAKWDNSQEFCPKCLADCDVCKGKKTESCPTQIALPDEVCQAEGCTGKTGTYNPKCQLCRGTGIIKTFTTCKVCKGTGEKECSVCRGTGKYPTCVVGGDHSRNDVKKPDCPHCKGSGRDHKEIPIDINRFVNARQGTMLFLGPIEKITVQQLDGRTITIHGMPDQGKQYPVLAIEKDEPGCGAYFVGGVWAA